MVTCFVLVFLFPLLPLLVCRWLGRNPCLTPCRLLVTLFVGLFRAALSYMNVILKGKCVSLVLCWVSFSDWCGLCIVVIVFVLISRENWCQLCVKIVISTRLRSPRRTTELPTPLGSGVFGSFVVDCFTPYRFAQRSLHRSSAYVRSVVPPELPPVRRTSLPPIFGGVSKKDSKEMVSCFVLGFLFRFVWGCALWL